MAIKTTLSQIEEVQTAISKVMAGQSVSIDGASVTMADLAKLELREQRLLRQYRVEQGERPPYRTANFSNSGYLS